MNTSKRSVYCIWLRHLGADFLSRGPGFEPGSSHLGFVVDKVAMGQVFSEYYSFPCPSLHRLLHTHRIHHLSLVKTKTPWFESASELYRPSDRSLSAKRLTPFADRGCHVVSVTDPYGRILGFLDRSRYFSIK
jgi:hypothetical protein